MSALQLLSSYLAEVVKEILRVVEDTVAEYREEAARTRRENQNLRSQLRDVLLLEAGAEWPRAGPIPSFSLEQLSLSENATSAVTPPTRHSVPAPQEPVPCPEQQEQQKEEEEEEVQGEEQEQQQQQQQEEEVKEQSPERVERKLIISTDVHRDRPERTTDGPRAAAFSPASVRVKEEPEERSLTESEAEERGDQRVSERGEDRGEDREERPDDGEEEAEWRGDDGGDWRELEETGLRQKPEPESPSVTRTDLPPPAVTQVLPRPLQPHGAPRCPRCSDTFPSPAALLHHLHQQKKTHRCHFCCKSFSQSADLRRHHRTHTGERPHRCSFCSRAFSQRGNLRRHLRIHTGERPYACPHCQRRFSDGDTLKKHLRTHGQARSLNQVQTVPGLYLNHI